MARKTVAQKLREELALSMDMNRNVIDALKVVRAERDLIRAEAEQLNSERTSMLATLDAVERRSQKKTQRLFQVIFDLHLKAAQHEGYIKRVTDLDGSRSQTTKVIDEEAGDGDILRFREEIYGAESETQRDSILDSIDTETLDQVLGKAPQKDRFLRDE